MTVADANRFVNSILSIAEIHHDLPQQSRPICRDPDDDYLVMLAIEADATYLVSSDRDLLELTHAGVVTRMARPVVESVIFTHAWGADFVPGTSAEAWRQAAARGADAVLTMVSAFVVALKEPDPPTLELIVTPELFEALGGRLGDLADAVLGRGLANGVDYPEANVALVKLPPDPGVTIRSIAQQVLRDSVVVTLHRRPELPHLPQTAGWRVHSVT